MSSLSRIPGTRLDWLVPLLPEKRQGGLTLAIAVITPRGCVLSPDSQLGALWLAGFRRRHPLPHAGYDARSAGREWVQQRPREFPSCQNLLSSQSTDRTGHPSIDDDDLRDQLSPSIDRPLRPSSQSPNPRPKQTRDPAHTHSKCRPSLVSTYVQQTEPKPTPTPTQDTPAAPAPPPHTTAAAPLRDPTILNLRRDLPLPDSKTAAQSTFAHGLTTLGGGEQHHERGFDVGVCRGEGEARGVG